jgi:hypothetical protein
MRRNIRDEVLAEHLLRVRARRDDLRRILGGGSALVVPTRYEKEGFQEDYARLGPVEAGLAELLPKGADRDERERRIPPRAEAVVLRQVREQVATSAVTLQRGGTRSPEEQDVALERSLAVFDYCTAELQRIADDEEALREARLLEARRPPRQLDDNGVQRFIAIGGWSILIGGWW